MAEDPIDTSWVKETEIRGDWTTDDGKHDIRWSLGTLGVFTGFGILLVMALTAAWH